MSTKDGTSSVFTDDSGSRKRVVMLAIRGATFALGLSVAAVAISIVGQVTLPGLDAPLQIPGVEHARTSAKNSEPVQDETVAEVKVVADSKSQVPSAVLTKKPSTPANPRNPTIPPTESTTPVVVKPQGKPTAKPTTAAHPVHVPGSPPTSPPGKSKTSDNNQ